MVIPIEELAQTYRATSSDLDPSERFAIAAKQLGIRGSEAKKRDRRRLVLAKVIDPSDHGGQRNGLTYRLESDREREVKDSIVSEFNHYFDTGCAEQIFTQTKGYVSPIAWVARQTGFPVGSVERILRNAVKRLETKTEEAQERYKKLMDKRRRAAYKDHNGDPRAAREELGYADYKHLAADWRAMGLTVNVDYRTVEARRNRISEMSIALTALDKEYTMHSVLK